MTIEEKRNKLDIFCCGKSCRKDECPLFIKELRCGRGQYFTSQGKERMSDEDVNLAYSIAFPGADNGTNNGIDAKDEHLAIVTEIIAKERDKAVEKYKAALLKKIFPYDAVDKKQYSINAYAVWQAINETEVHHD